MVTIYKYVNDEEKVVAKYEHNDEYEAINQYIKENNMNDAKIDIFGSHSGMVYSMHFYITTNGVKDEYMLIQRSFDWKEITSQFWKQFSINK